jgi:hypothetical protein
MARGSDEDMLARRHSAASIALLEADRLVDETAAFDVLVNGVYAGHWSETADSRAAIAWVGGGLVETELCGGEEEKVIAAIRSTIPPSLLQRVKASRQPAPHHRELEQALLCDVISCGRHRLTVDQLVSRNADPADHMAMASVYCAIRDLRRTGLLHYGSEEIVEATQAALHAHALFTVHE